MTVKPENGDPSIQSVFEAYGATMYIAQILESDLQIILTQLEKARLVQIDREQYKITEDKFGVIEACIGPMLYLMREHATVDFPPDAIDDLRKANAQRNRLAHSFLVQRSVDLFTCAGRADVLHKLARMRSHLWSVMMRWQRLRNMIYASFGLTEEVMTQRMDAMLRELGIIE